MACLLDLPPEIVEQIVFVLAEEKPPSAKFLHEEPSDRLLRSGHHPLKDLSQTCRAARSLCFPSLFSVVKVDLDSIGGFLEFAKCHSLYTHADSLVFYIDRKSQAEKSTDVPSYNLWLPMVRVVDLVKPSLMTVVLPPSLFAETLPYQLNLDDQWVFDISYQVLQLKMSLDLAPVSHISQDTIASWDIFQMRPWTHCTFNQGSSIKGYCSYEYFYKQTPSIFNPRDRDEFFLRMMEGSFENLTSVDYIAVFPIDNIFRFTQCMSLMKNLKCLRVQFSATPNNDVLDNPAALCQAKDLWQELESCYYSLTHFIRFNWDERPMSLEEFVSLDYASPSLRELIDRTAGRNLLEWGDFDPNEGRWTRKEESSRGINP